MIPKIVGTVEIAYEVTGEECGLVYRSVYPDGGGMFFVLKECRVYLGHPLKERYDMKFEP